MVHLALNAQCIVNLNLLLAYSLHFVGKDGFTRVYPKVSGLATWSENRK
jgi:hypothetical protein